MKLNTRVLALSLAFGAVAAAQAQNVTFKLVYADAIGAGLNGAAIGDAFVDHQGWRDRYFVRRRPRCNWRDVDARYGAGGLMVCFDTATTNNTNYGRHASRC